MDDAPAISKQDTLKAAWFDTKLGSMISIADEKGLYLLEFVDCCGLEREIDRLRKKLKVAIIPGENKVLKQIQAELHSYFNGECYTFKTPIQMIGSDFQKMVWSSLIKIPVGQTQSYSDIAKLIHKPTAFRAVANANGTNQLAIIIPCHRVINANGGLGGYAGGVARKRWLLAHEYTHFLN